MRRYALISLSLALALPLAAETVRVYQTNAAGDAVDIIDPATNKVVMQIKDLEAVHGVSFSPDGTRAYFTVEGNNTLAAADTKTGKVLGSVKLSGHPNNLDVSADGKYVFAGIRDEPGAVDVIEAATMKNIKSIPVKGAVHNVYRAPGGEIVTGSVAGGIVTVIDPVKFEPVWEIKLGAGVRPMTFEANPDGSTKRLFAQLSDFHGFVVVDFKTREEVARIALPNEPGGGHAHSGTPNHGMGVAPDNKTLWVNSHISNGVFAYSLPDLKVKGFVKTGYVPDWLTITPDSKMVYVANAGSNTVSAVDAVAMKEIAQIPVGEVPKRNGTVTVP
jgi:YVTN family beta-propeller protein